jgi:branched-chain amino acid transport system substrate-binding protein
MRLVHSPGKLAATAALLIAAVTACGSSANSGTDDTSGGSGLNKSPVVIGNVGVYSGTFGSQDLQTLHSLQAWVAWTNSHGGLNGHPVKLVSHDDANDPAKSLLAVKEMVEQDHAVAIVAPNTSGTASAWAGYVKQKKVPVLGGLSVDANWLDNPYLLATSVTLDGYHAGTVTAAKTVGSKIGELACAEVAACKAGITTFADAAKKAGLEWAGAQLVSASAPDYTAQCIALKNAGANVIFPAVSGPTAIHVVKACATQGYKPALVLPAANITSDVLADSAFEGAVGITVSPLWFGDPTFTQDWKDAYTTMFPNEVLNGYSTMGWQAGVVLAKALANAPDTVTSDTVLQGLYAQPAGSTYGGWTPPLTFTPGKPATVAPCMWYVQIKNHEFTAPKGDAPICAASS